MRRKFSSSMKPRREWRSNSLIPPLSKALHTAGMLGLGVMM